MQKRKLLLSGLGLVAMSTAAYATFSTSEFGSGTLSTGSGSGIVLSSSPSSVDEGICGTDGCDSTEDAALTALGNAMIADGSATSDGSAAQDAVIAFFDNDEDGTLTASEVVRKFENMSGISFTYSSAQQAGALLKGIATHCGATIDATCLASAASDGDDFVEDAIITAGTSVLGSLKTAFSDSSTNYSVGDSDALKIFDTNDDGTISESEFVNLLAKDDGAGSSVRTTGNGLYARAYATELASGSSVSDAVADGNTWAVYPPSIGTVPTINMDGTSSSSLTSTALPVYDGTCGASDFSGCTASPANVTHTITQTHTAPTGLVSTTSASSTLFALNSSGQIALASGVNVQDLDAGTYTLSITSTDANTSQTYGKTTTTPKTATLKVSNENGCITNTQVTGADFNANTDSITGAAVSITGSFDSSDLLFIQGPNVTVQTVGANSIKKYTTLGVSGVTEARYDPSTGIMRFYGTTTEANWVSLFKRVGYIFNSGSSPTTTSRTLAFTLSNRVPYLHSDGSYHYYEYYSDNDIKFKDAREDAAAKTLFGMTGYLATPTSQAEQDVLTEKVQGIGWLGACDRLDNSNVMNRCGVSSGDKGSQTHGEGYWYWVTGPEKMTQFGRDQGSSAWTPTNNAYENWNGTAGPDEPNNCCSSSEHYLHVWSSARWNDFAHDNGAIQGYLVEWGGLSTDPVRDLDQTVSYSIPNGDANFCTYAE
ncbi:MAG: hypothetical protein ACON4V_00450 [Parvibaculales bacterium]